MFHGAPLISLLLVLIMPSLFSAPRLPYFHTISSFYILNLRFLLLAESRIILLLLLLFQRAQILTTLPGHKAAVNCTYWLPTSKFAFRGFLFLLFICCYLFSFWYFKFESIFCVAWLRLFNLHIVNTLYNVVLCLYHLFLKMSHCP